MVELPPFLQELTQRKARRQWGRDRERPCPVSLHQLTAEFDHFIHEPGWERSPRGRWVIFNLMRAGLLFWNGAPDGE